MIFSAYFTTLLPDYLCVVSQVITSLPIFIDHHLIEQHLQALSHRGPDDQGHYLDSENGICLLQTRLSVLDTSPSGHQPMLASDGSVVIIFNGEIYNFIELRIN